MKYYFSLILLQILFLVTSCGVDSTCRKDLNVIMGVSFYKKTLSSTTNTYTTTLTSIDSLTVQGIDSLGMPVKHLSSSGVIVDSALYKNVSGVNKISLQLNKSKYATESKYVITYKKKSDTIVIVHNNSDQYLSLECGCIKVHSIDTVIVATKSFNSTKNFIESVKITNHDVNTTNAEHLQIYF